MSDAASARMPIKAEHGDRLGRRRLRRATFTSVASLAARAASFLSFLLLVPLTLSYLGPERYGIWMTLLSIVGIFGLANLGLGNALITLIARTDAGDDPDEASHLVSTAVIMLTLVALLAAVCTVFIYGRVPWQAVYNLSSNGLAVDAQRATMALIVVFLLTLPTGIVGQVRQGYQEGYVNGWLDAASSLLVLLLVAVVVASNGPLFVLVAVVALSALISAAANWWLLLRSRPNLRPRWSYADSDHARLLLRSGSLFFVLSLAIVVGYSSDNFVAAQVLGPAAVTDYAVPARLALAGMAVLAILVGPLWPAYAEALARSDSDWTVRTFRRSLLVCGGGSIVFAVLLVLFGRPFIEWWSGGEVLPSYGLLVGLALWVILGSIGNALAMLLNAAHVVRPQVICAILMATANIALSIVLARQVGVAGLIWGTVISYLGFVVLPYLVIVPRLLRRLQPTRG
jgi:O-antigen/teichoic acid export membrane protein